MKQKPKSQKYRTRINEQIRSKDVRLIGVGNENVGIVSTKEALLKARDAGLDLVEISAKANPPITKIVDYGKWKYEQNKKKKGSSSKIAKKSSEVKSLQVKIVTGQDAVKMRVKKIEEWFKEGHQVRVDLFLFGRYKFMDGKFLEGRLRGFLDLISQPYTIVEDIKRSPKGYSVLIQGVKAKKDNDKEENDKDK